MKSYLLWFCIAALGFISCQQDDPTLPNVTSQTWGGFNPGIDGPIDNMIVHNGELYMSGTFFNSGGVVTIGCTKYDGTNFTSLGTSSIPGISSLCEYSGELYAIGSFEHNGTIGPHLAKMSGITWNVITLVDSLPVPHEVTPYTNTNSSGLTVYQNKLVIAASTEIYTWDGTTVGKIGGLSMNSNNIQGITVYNSELIAMCTPQNSTFGLHKWDGNSWVSIQGQTVDSPVIWDMVEYNGELYIGGDISSIGGISTNNVAKWNGTTWSRVGDGQTLISSGLYSVYDLSVYNGKLFVATQTLPNPNLNYRSIKGLVWDGTVWDSIATTPQLFASPMSICGYNGKIYTGVNTTLNTGNTLFSVDE